MPASRFHCARQISPPAFKWARPPRTWPLIGRAEEPAIKPAGSGRVHPRTTASESDHFTSGPRSIVGAGTRFRRTRSAYYRQKNQPPIAARRLIECAVERAGVEAFSFFFIRDGRPVYGEFRGRVAGGDEELATGTANRSPRPNGLVEKADGPKNHVCATRGQSGGLWLAPPAGSCVTSTVARAGPDPHGPRGPAKSEGPVGRPTHLISKIAGRSGSGGLPGPMLGKISATGLFRRRTGHLHPADYNPRQAIWVAPAALRCGCATFTFRRNPSL